MIKNIVTPANDAGRFSNGDPTKGIPGTVVTAEFLNGLIDAIVSMSCEIKEVLSAAEVENIGGAALLAALDALYLKKDEKGTDVGSASTMEAGIVKLNDTVTSVSTTEAATARVVKLAYDLAKEAKDKSAQSATTIAAGVVKLNDTVTSTSTTEAATARAVKQAFDLANTANGKIVLPVFGVAQNGYFIAPPDENGRRMILQWGNGSRSGSFVIPFPNAVFSINVMGIGAIFFLSGLTNSGYSGSTERNTSEVVSASVKWIAIGY